MNMDDNQSSPPPLLLSSSKQSSKLSVSTSSSSSSSSLIPINTLIEQILVSLRQEWISECDQLCQLLQRPHLLALMQVVDCVARQIFDVEIFANLEMILDNTSKSNLKIIENLENYDTAKLETFLDITSAKTMKLKMPTATTTLVYSTPRKKRRPCQKIIQVIKSDEPLGVTVRFDERTGDIILARILVGGAAYRSGLVQVGDHILEVNGIPLRGRSHLDVINILQRESMKTIITLKIVVMNWQPSFDSTANSQALKSYLVKACFDYKPEQDPQIPCPSIGLAFDKGSILNVLNKDDANWWQASKQIELSSKSRMEIFQIAGLIPSKRLQERRIVAIRDIKSQLDRERYIHILGGLLPLPFRKNKWCAQKIKKIMYDLSDCIRYDREEISTYEPVARYFPRSDHCRPIVLVGPSGVGCSLLISLLCQQNPNRYREPLAHTTRYKRFQENDSIDYYFVNEDWMEHEIQTGNFVCYSKYRGNYYGLHRDTNKQIVDAGAVCIFKMDAQFLRLVHTAEFKPYIIFIQPPYDLDRLIETRSRNYYDHSDSVSSQYSQRKSKQRFAYEMHLMIYESHKLQILYGHKFDTTLINDDLKETFNLLLDTVRMVEMKPTWIPIAWIQQQNKSLCRI